MALIPVDRRPGRRHLDAVVCDRTPSGIRDRARAQPRLSLCALDDESDRRDGWWSIAQPSSARRRSTVAIVVTAMIHVLDRISASFRRIETVRGGMAEWSAPGAFEP
jgi:hypothetical protein